MVNADSSRTASRTHCRLRRRAQRRAVRPGDETVVFAPLEALRHGAAAGAPAVAHRPGGHSRIRGHRSRPSGWGAAAPWTDSTPSWRGIPAPRCAMVAGARCCGGDDPFSPNPLYGTRGSNAASVRIGWFGITCPVSRGDGFRLVSSVISVTLCGGSRAMNSLGSKVIEGASSTEGDRKCPSDSMLSIDRGKLRLVHDCPTHLRSRSIRTDRLILPPAGIRTHPRVAGAGDPGSTPIPENSDGLG